MVDIEHDRLGHASTKSHGSVVYGLYDSVDLLVYVVYLIVDLLEPLRYLF